jgi:hypothetical protein
LSENHVLNTLGLEDEPSKQGRVVIAVVDSGISAAKTNKFCGQWDFRNGERPSWKDDVDGVDPYGHGTHVAGLIANDGRDSGSLYRGVAPGIKCLLSLRVLDEDGTGYTSDVIRANEWVLKNQSKAKVDIINLSLGHPIQEPAAQDPLVQVVEAAVRAGIVVIAVGRQLRAQPGHRRAGLCGNYLSWQRPLRYHRRSTGHPPNGRAQRRRGHSLQLAGPHVVRRLCEARSRRAR